LQADARQFVVRRNERSRRGKARLGQQPGALIQAALDFRVFVPIELEVIVIIRKLRDVIASVGLLIFN